MKVIVDDKIPYIREALSLIADGAVYLPGKEFTPEAVRDADALIVRTRTRCDRALLEGSRVRFIATATIGFDHIDTDYCRRAGIAWTNAPGCNAASVAQYLHSVFVLLSRKMQRSLSSLTLGIVGVGHVGSRVAEVARHLGLNVLLCDPPRQAAEGNAPDFVTLQQIAAECDLITFHVPLAREGKYPTFHLADEAFFASLRRHPILINTSRGEVVDTAALLSALESGQVADAVIDVWENEPDINRALLYKVYIGTPHIAGYSADGKVNATRMSLEALCRHFGIEANYRIEAPAPAQPSFTAATPEDAQLHIYDPRVDSRALKLQPDRFESLRGNYPLRREAEAYSIQYI